MKLKDKKILIIGDTGRKRHYEQLVSEFGGKFLFIDGVKDINRARKEAKKCDILFHIVAFTKHNLEECIDGFAMRVRVNRDGISSLRDAMKSIENGDFSAVVSKNVG